MLFRKKHQPDNTLIELQDRIKYRFKDIELLKHSLTHKSSVSQEDKKGLNSNERLEFLGDSVLNLISTEYLYKHNLKNSEGQLSKIKSLLVSRKIIGEIGEGLDLGNYLILGGSEKKTGCSAKHSSIISNAFEALLGAVYLDGGINAAHQILERFLFCRIKYILNDEHNINYKSKILELSQGNGFGIPEYPLLSEEGPDHLKKFRVGIEIAGVRLGEGCGSTKKNAQQEAAKEAYSKYSEKLILSHLKGEKKK